MMRALLLSLFVLLPACAFETDEDFDDEEPTESETQELRIRNPVKTGCADPSVMKHGNAYYMTCTGGDGQGNLFPIYSSTNLLQWTRAGEVFKAGQTPAWAKGNYWAPELHHTPSGKIIATFTALSKATSKNAIGVATSTSPTGPFVDKGGPLVSSSVNSAIDSHTLMNGSRLILYYKSERKAGGNDADVIRAVELTGDGLATKGAARTVLEYGERWEGGVVEAPWVIKRGSFYYMFYSGNAYCNNTYAVGVARSKDPLGGFAKLGRPILKSGDRWAGPGHNAVTTGPDGRQWMIYHAYRLSEGTPKCKTGPGDNNKRHTLVDRIVFKNGWPRVVSNL